jgi:hypothetical protein
VNKAGFSHALLYRGFPTRKGCELLMAQDYSTACLLEIGDTASKAFGVHRFVPQGGMR